MREWITDEPALKVHDVRDFLRMKVPPRDLLLTPWLESASLSMIYAARGMGKTHFAMNIAYALATGGSYLKWKAAAPVPVLYIDGEMPASDMQARWGALFKIAGEPEEGMLRVVSRDAQLFHSMPNLGSVEGQDAIAANIGEARVIILDNLSALIHGTKENEAEGWEPVGQWAIRQRSRGRSLIFVHHAGKSGGQRGTSKREDLLDIVIKLERPADYKKTEGARFTVSFDKARSLYGAQVAPFEAKLQMLESGAPRWSVAEVNDDDEIAELQSQGLSLGQIGARVGCDKSTVKRRLDRKKHAF